MKQMVFIFALILLLTGCNEKVVTFNQPQPEGVDTLTTIPGKLVGQYIGKDGATILNIDRQCIVLHYDYEVKQPKDSVDWDNLTTKEKRNYILQGDSIVEHIVDVDTLFYFSENNVLKKYKGYYFLSSREDKGSWYVQKLKLQKGLLTLGSISTKEELESLERINESPVDTTTYQLKFTKKQFHEYIDDGGFSKADTFTRITSVKNKVK